MISWRWLMARILFKIILLILVLLLIYGCTPRDTPPIPTSTHLPTPIPTSTHLPTPIPTSTYLPTPMPEDLRKQIMEEYIAAIDPVLSEWYENIEIANERRQYSVFENLSRIRNEFVNLEIDPYFDSKHAQMILHMDCQIASHFALVDPQDYYEYNPEVDYEILFSRCSYPVQE
jgi:hypothetical protein